MGKKVSHIGRDPDIDLHFPHDASAPAAARKALKPLWKTPSDPISSDVELVASELVSNVIRHTDEGGTMRAWDPEPDVPLRLEVSDSASTAPTLPAEPREIGGQGLPIVSALADEWGVEQLPSGAGKTVWAEFVRDDADD